MIFSRLLGRKTVDASSLYGAIVAAARQPKFYAQWQVPDTIDGRFDVLVLHMYLAVARLKAEKPDLAQGLIDVFCENMDDNLREMGAGDQSVPKKVRQMAEALHGRMKAYDAAVGERGLSEALQRNLYAGNDNAHAVDVARWVENAKASLAQQASSAIVSGQVDFP